jgi:hypothetical protein
MTNGGDGPTANLTAKDEMLKYGIARAPMAPFHFQGHRHTSPGDAVADAKLRSGKHTQP